MDYLSLPRKPEMLEKTLQVQEDGSVIALRKLEVHLLQRWEESWFTTVGETVSSYLVAGIVTEDYFFSLTALLQVEFLPRDMEVKTIDTGAKRENYNVLLFEKGDVVIENINVMRDNNAAYKYFTEFKKFARVPWYVDNNTLSGLFDNAAEECGGRVGIKPQAIRVYDAFQYRDPDNYNTPYRYSKAMLEGRPPVIVGLNNVSMLVESTMAKSMGGYLNQSTIAAIVNPSDRVTITEKVIKGAID
ncbi:virion structural protein [Shewanella phage FishSpeaker]|nr:virion structural protein [Shewanella phage FishSpeaker]